MRGLAKMKNGFTCEEIMALLEDFFRSKSGLFVNSKMKWIGYKKLGQSRRTGGGRKPDFVGLLNNIIYIGETKSSKELNGLNKIIWVSPWLV